MSGRSSCSGSREEEEGREGRGEGELELELAPAEISFNRPLQFLLRCLSILEGGIDAGYYPRCTKATLAPMHA